MALLTYWACTSVRLRFIPSSLNIATWFPAFWNSPALWVPANPQPLTDNRPPHRKRQMSCAPVNSGHALASAATGYRLSILWLECNRMFDFQGGLFGCGLGHCSLLEGGCVVHILSVLELGGALLTS